MLDNRENLQQDPGTPPGSIGSPRIVTFNSHAMETSMGGTETQTCVKFNDSSILSTVSLNSSTTSIASAVSLSSASSTLSDMVTPVKGRTKQVSSVWFKSLAFWIHVTPWSRVLCAWGFNFVIIVDLLIKFLISADSSWENTGQWAQSQTGKNNSDDRTSQWDSTETSPPGAWHLRPCHPSKPD